MGFDNNSGEGRAVFNVGAGAGTFAPEEFFLKVIEIGQASGNYHKVRQLRVLMEAAPPAGGVAEIWVLRSGGDPSNAAHWFYSGINVAAAGLSALIELAGVSAVRIRGKSGGAAGAIPISAWWV